MKSFKITQLISIGCLIAVTACQPSKEVVERDRVRISVNDQMSATELVEAAEQLVGPATFMLAYSTAKMALEKDPTNLKAEFLVKYLQRFEAFRGYFQRSMPLMSPEQQAWQKKFIEEQNPNSPLKNFLMDTKNPAFKTISNSQVVLDEYFQAVVQFREFLKKNSNAELTLNINPHVFERQAREDNLNACKWIETGDRSFQYICENAHILQRKMNAADLVALRQITSAEIIYSFFNSYSFDGLEKLNEFDKDNSRTNKERAEFLAALPNFGKLTKASTIHLFQSLGADYYTAARWVIDSQKQLCPKGYTSRDQRKGYLFSAGLCVEDSNEVEKGLAVLQRALGGVMELEVEGKNDQMYKMNVDVFAWSKNPIQDLRQIAPTTWDQCDQAVSLRDNSIGGMFVDNNYNVLLAKPCFQ